MFPKALCIPYGYNLVTGELVENVSEMAVIAKMRLWREEGQSYDTISDRFNSMNIPSKRDRVWHGAMVNKILKREGKK